MRATRLIGLGILVIVLLVACGTGGGGTTPPPSSGLQIAVSGLPDGANANIRVLGPGGYQEKVTEDRTLSSLTAGSYEVIASMVAAASGDVYAASEASRTVSITATSGARVEVAYETEPAILTDDAVVLSNETIAALSSFTPAGASALRTQQVAGGDVPYGEFEFSVDTNDLQDLEIGDVFSLGATPEAPYGAIGRVTSIDRSSGTVRVYTSEARLSDAVERGRGIATQEVSADTILTQQSISPTLDVQSLTPAQDGEVCWALNGSLAIDADSVEVVPGVGDTNASVRGEYCIDPRPLQLALEVRNGELFVETIVEWSTTNSLEIDFSQELGFDSGFIPLHTIVFTPITFLVGPVPVVLLPEIQIGIELEGGVVGGVAIGLAETTTMTVGARVQGKAFEPIFAQDKDYTPNLTPRLGVQASVGAGAKTRFMLYGLTGGTLKFGVYANFEADGISQEWALTAGLNPSIGWDFDVLVYEVSADWDLFKETLTFPIANGTFSGIQVYVTPEDVTLAPGETQTLTAILTGSDQDVTWTLDGSGCGTLTPSANDALSATYTAPSTPQSIPCTVTVTSVEDQYASATATITIQPPGDPPTITGPTVVPNPGTAGEQVTIQFEVTSTETPVTCRIDVDNNGVTEYVINDCTLQSQAQPHTYAEEGDYTVVVRATDARGQATEQSTTITQNTSGAVEPAGLIAHWQFDECADLGRDATGSGFDGTLGGSAECMSGPIGSALGLPNASDFLEVPQDFTLPSSGFTTAFWVRIAQANTDYNYFLNGATTSRDNAFNFAWNPRTGAIEMLFGTQAGQPSSSTINLVGVWHHLAFVNDAGAATIYIDGEPFHTYAFSAQATPVQHLVMGQDQDCFAGCFEADQALLGGLDDIRIYDGPLTSAEIQALAASASGTVCDGSYLIDDVDTETDLFAVQGCGEITGSLRIENTNLTSLSGLDALRSIGVDLVISGNGTLVDLSGLNSLTEVGDDLVVSDNGSLTSLTGLGSLVEVGFAPVSDGFVYILRNDALVSLTGLDALAQAGTQQYIDDNGAFDCSPYNTEPYALDFFPVTGSSGNLVNCVTD